MCILVSLAHAWLSLRTSPLISQVGSPFKQFSKGLLIGPLVAIFPIPILASLTISKIRKLAIIGIFSVGFLSVIASVVRFAQVMATTGKNEPSVFWQATWGMIKMCVGMDEFHFSLPREERVCYQWLLQPSNSSQAHY